jgi:hypothetical protein
MAITDPAKKKQMVIVLTLVLAACGAWISYQLFFTGPGIPQAGTIPDTPEYREMMELTAKLKEDERFKTLEITRNADGKFVAAGAIPRTADEEALRAKLRELKPDADWVVDVVPMNK